MKQKPYIYLAVKALRTHAEFALRNDDLSTLEWFEDESVVPRPSDEAILAKAEELRAYDETHVYQERRAPRYPPLADLADALYWAQKGDDTKLTEYVAACDAVKLLFPKPTE